MLSFQWNEFLGALSALLLLIRITHALKNTTIDDSDYDRITYTDDTDWQHATLQGFEYLFYNGSRSYTYVPGASASFSFTGSGIFLQGPYANDQALRRVSLDGNEVGVFNAHAEHRSPSAVFWGTRGLASTTHTVVVTHNDTATKILAMDAWIVEFEESQTNSMPGTAGVIPHNAARASKSFGYGMAATVGITIALLLSFPAHGWTIGCYR